MDNLDTAQLEQLRAIGEYLSQVRQEQSRSLEDIATKTYIPLRLLRAIEAGHEKVLPEPVFVQGFIRRYGDVLGLDGKQLAQQFPIHTTIPSEDPQALTATEAPVYQPSLLQEGRLAEAERPTWLYGAGIVALLLVVGGIAYSVFKPAAQPSTSPAVTGIAQKPSPKAKVAPSSSASTSPRSTPLIAASPMPDAPTSTAQSAPVMVSIALTDDAWMQVTVDGQPKFEGTLPKGSRRSWSGKQKITVVSGNAGGVSIVYNQGSPTVMGKLGMVEEKTFTAQ